MEGGDAASDDAGRGAKLGARVEEDIGGEGY